METTSSLMRHQHRIPAEARPRSVRRGQRAVVANLLAGLVWFSVAELSASTKATNSPGTSIVVRVDGSIAAQVNSAAGPRIYTFGFPARAAVRHWAEEGGFPICHSGWEHNGVRYTQTVIVTRLEPGPLSMATPLSRFAPEALPREATRPDAFDQPCGQSDVADAVILVQLSGLNTANEYTDASTEFNLRFGNRLLNLDWKDGLVYAAGDSKAGLLALIDVPSGALVRANPQTVHVSGKMPPGTSGSMTAKIPLAKALSDSSINRLAELDFDEEIRRLKKFWLQHRQGLQAAPVSENE